MPGYTVPQAAAAVGRNRSSVLRAIRAGRLSAVRDDATGDWRIDAAELHRLYPARSEVHAPDDAGSAAPSRTQDDALEIAVLRARLTAAETSVQVHAETIQDLRRRLDTEAEERRRLTMVLADMRAAPVTATPTTPQPAPTPARRSWWRWAR